MVGEGQAPLNTKSHNPIERAADGLGLPCDGYGSPVPVYHALCRPHVLCFGFESIVPSERLGMGQHGVLARDWITR